MIKQLMTTGLLSAGLVLASFAAATALLTSSAFDAGKRPTTSEVSAGLMFSNHSPDADLIHSPPI